MIDRINLILKAKNVTARQFAEEIGIQPSGMSHILGGRNNPSLDFVQKVIRRYPEIDANWLLLGRGEMYASKPQGADVATVEHAASVAPTLFDDGIEAEDEVVPTVEEPVSEADVPSDGVGAKWEATKWPAEAEPKSGQVAASVADYEAEEDAPMPKEEQQKAEAEHRESVPMAAEAKRCDGDKRDGVRRLKRVLLIYNDNTFCELSPAELML